MTTRHLAAFFALTFLIGWGVPGAALGLSFMVDGLSLSLAMYSPLYYVGVWSPALAAMIVVGKAHGAGALRAFVGRLMDWRFPAPWWGFALLCVPALYFLGAVAQRWVGGLPVLPAWEFSLLPFVVMAAARATAGPVEELGWRGFAQPMLQRYMAPWAAVLIVALVHAIWHFPVFLIGQFAHFGTELPLAVALGRFTVQILAITVIFAIAYNASRGSLTLAFLIHLMTNLAYPWKVDADYFAGQTAMLAIAALVMAATVGRRRWLRPDHAAIMVIPGDDDGTGVRPRRRPQL